MELERGLLGQWEQALGNRHRKCVTSHERPFSISAVVFQSDHVDVARQKLKFGDDPAKRPGFYVIQDDFGKCLIVIAGNKDIIAMPTTGTSSGNGATIADDNMEIITWNINLSE